MKLTPEVDDIGRPISIVELGRLGYADCVR
jgi:hypothetical protein